MMQDLSMNILDIAQNSLRAGASCIQIQLVEHDNILELSVEDDGIGMDEEMVERVQDPFFTTRTTRKIGLGIPFLKAIAQQCEGTFSLTSKVNEGTLIRVSMALDHWDCPPLGDVGDVLMIAASADVKVRFIFTYRKNEKEFVFDTQQINEVLGEGIDIRNAEIFNWCKAAVNEGIASLRE